MLNPGTRTIETERLTLRRYKKEDAEAVFENWGSDPAVSKYLSWLPHSSVTVTKAYLEGILRDYKRVDSYHWCIVLKETGQPVGSIDVVRHNSVLNVAEIGYLIARPLWNKGCMTEALSAVLGYLFLDAGFNRVEACHHIKNLASGHVMEKAGMRFEGITRDGAKDNMGKFCDIARYAILHRDFTGRPEE